MNLNLIKRHYVKRVGKYYYHYEVDIIYNLINLSLTLHTKL